MEIITHSREETVAAGREFAKTLPRGALIAFTGGLGAGKTAFCQGLAEGLGCTDPVSSPTFAIVNYYRGPRPLAHFDLYRIHTENDLAAAGFYDYLDMGAVVACEWSENCADLLEQGCDYLGDREGEAGVWVTVRPASVLEQADRHSVFVVGA